MSVYDLNHTYYLWEDIKEILSRIDSLYSFENIKDKRFYNSKISIDSDIHWASKDTNEIFNKLIPKFKSIHKDMYSIIEAIFKYKNNGDFSIKILSNKYQYFNEFRLLNNKLKHFTPGSVEINLIQLVMMEGNKQKIDVMCQFKYSNGTFVAIRYSDFIEIFLLFLNDNELISFE
jgi:hypothetical protein